MSRPSEEPFSIAPEPAAGRFLAAARVQAERVDWLWQDRIPRGAVTILAGDPGQGKSVLTCELAARVSRGQALPGGGTATPATVAMMTAEDALGAVVRPRLELAGADLERVVLFHDEGESLTFPSGIDTLRAYCESERPAMVVVDPVVAFIDPELNTHRDQHVRSALRPLAAMAELTSTAVVVVMHLNKAQGGQPMYRLGGSIGFAGAARSMLLFARRPDTEDTDPRRIVAVAKSSYAAPAPSVELTLAVREGDGHPTVGWMDEVSGMGAADLLQPPSDAEDRSERQDAVDFLLAVLADGPRPAKEVMAEARSAGHAPITLKRARRAAGVRSAKRGFGESGEWLWSLDEDAALRGSPPLTPLEGHPPDPLSRNRNGKPFPTDHASNGDHPSMGDPLSGESAPAEVFGAEIGRLYDRASRGDQNGHAA